MTWIIAGILILIFIAGNFVAIALARQSQEAEDYAALLEQKAANEFAKMLSVHDDK